MFDDSKRLDALEAQMKSVMKFTNDFNAEVIKLRKSTDERFSYSDAYEDSRGKAQQRHIDDIEKAAKDTDASLKKALQRIAYLEQQVKKLSK